MKNWKKYLSVLLAVLMVASAVSIGAILAYHLPQEGDTKLSGNNIVISEKESTVSVKEERNDEILDIEDKNPVPDEMLEAPAKEDAAVSAGNMSAKPEEEEEKMNVSVHYDENNNIKIPFDQIYPEEFEEGVFEYDEETLMIKVGSLSEERKAELSKAGVLKTEEMMKLENAVWYVAYIEKGGDITEVMEKVRGLDFVKVAEYNFKYEAAASIIDSDEISKNVIGNASINDQWYLKSCGIQKAWKHLESESLPMAGQDVVVAVIDTGVDYDHIDLAGNMWKNTAEVPDNGMDDDGNGYVDDYYGIDIVHGSGNGDDDHGHGTHVAGIIAASNNKEGIVGIAYNSKIMAVKAGQASGYFHSDDIAKAIIYAYENGAEVINMSFGGTASSIAVQDALAVAYSRCVLVAAAGNSGAHNEYYIGAQPNYPAALSYVLGVMSVSSYGVESAFTNWDVLPYSSAEYELYAPGEQITSTIPGDKYATWSGTSMAAPVVSAIAANLRAAYPDRDTYSTKFIYGQLASTSETYAVCINPQIHGPHNLPQIVNAYSALTEMPKPEVDVSDFAIFDSEKLSANNNGDGVIDAGETFELGFTLKNRWGKSENTKVIIDSISEGGVANRYVTFEVDEIGGGEDFDQPDGILDKYQAVVTYRIINGTWKDGTSSDIKKLFTTKIQDENGNWVDSGATLGTTVPTGMIPNEGYEEAIGEWNVLVPERATPVTESELYTFAYHTEDEIIVSYSVVNGFDANSGKENFASVAAKNKKGETTVFAKPFESEGNAIQAITLDGEALSENEIKKFVSNGYKLSVDTAENHHVSVVYGFKEYESEVNYGEVGTYSEKDAGKILDNDMHVGWKNPYYITAAKDTPNDYIIRINYRIEYENALDEKDENIYATEGAVEVAVRQGSLVPNDIREDLTLTNDRLWVVPYSVLIREGATVTVEEGTQIQFYCTDSSDPYAETGVPYIEVAGTLLFKGTEENHIRLFPSELYSDHVVQIFESNGGTGYISMEYCDMVNPYMVPYSYTDRAYVSYAYGCEFSIGTRDKYGELHYRQFQDGQVKSFNAIELIDIAKAENCVFYKLGYEGEYQTWYANIPGDGFGKRTYKNCIFVDSILHVRKIIAEDCVFIGCKGTEVVGINYDIANAVYLENPLNDSVYVSCSFAETTMNYAEVIFEYMDAEWACFETEEEMQARWNSQAHAYPHYIGLKYDEEKEEYYWVNGAKVEDFVLDAIVEGEKIHEYGIYLDGKIYFDNSYRSKSPNPDFYWVVAEVKEGSEYYEKLDSASNVEARRLVNDLFTERCATEAFDQISGNAVINRMTETDPTTWFRMMAVEDDSHEREFNISKNYWGTTNLELIEKQIIDFDDAASYAQLNPGSFLTEAPENVWPFVVDAGTMVNGAEFPIVGSGETTFFVEFNRDMDTSIPLDVYYGSSYPYTEHKVEGEFVTPRRWEGTANISTLIEGGTQYMSISNGKAADSNQKLYTDWGRFTFEIDLTEALAMNLQAHAEDTGIALEWFQDDFDTLMGYNLYRSTIEDGYYERINDTVIPVDVTTFFDDEVEPGTFYYYNFTVVKTDLTESVPSGKCVIMAKDTMAPDLYHTPVSQAFTGNNIVINATVMDNVGVQGAKLYYRTAGTENWKTLEMSKNNDRYSAIIPSADVTTAGIEYYLEAFDGISYTYKGSASEPYVIFVQLAVSASDKGDVDGNGVINNKDALMLLQAANDLLNLDAEQFARADINDNKTLEAMEALRILQYANGKITSILF